jgi:NAD(P)-dependent dehydrogenase (short-subunit alcohol dehydrogenase family)
MSPIGRWSPCALRYLAPKDIRVNAILAGVADTPRQRAGTPAGTI